MIAGDSIIQHVHGWEHSNEGWEHSNEDCNVAVKSFSGSKLEDMKDYLNPLIRRKPDEIMLHIGTNNLKDADMEPQNLAEGISSLALQIITNSPSMKISVSSSITLQDNSSRINKINETNNRLKAICISYNWCFIDNGNVDTSCLNRRGLHLNRKGSSLLSRNFLRHLSK